MAESSSPKPTTVNHLTTSCELFSILSYPFYPTSYLIEMRRNSRLLACKLQGGADPKILA